MVYHVGREAVRGTLVNLSVGGAHVASEYLPPQGTELQIALLDPVGKPEMWLDALVVRHSKNGFGTVLKQAVARSGKTHLQDLLQVLFGVTRPAIRSMQPTEGGGTVQVFLFPRLEPDDALLRNSGPTRTSTENRMQAIVLADDAWDESLTDISLEEVEFVGNPRGMQVVKTESGEFPAPALHHNEQGTLSAWSRIRGVAAKISGTRIRPSTGRTTIDLDSEPMPITYLWAGHSDVGKVTAATREYIVLRTSQPIPRIGMPVEVRLPLNSGNSVTWICLFTRLSRIKRELPDSYLILDIEEIDESSVAGVYGLVVELFRGAELP